jgi:hypothetical protein
MLLSYVRFAPRWIGDLYDDLPVLLKTNHVAYDAFNVSKRLPSAAPSQIAGPTTRAGLLMWALMACVGLVLAARRRRLQSIVLGLLLLSSFVDLYMAYVGDSVEVQRHMVGPLSRMALILVLCVCMGVDELLDQWRRPKADSE